MSYHNIAELLKYHPYGLPAYEDRAGVTDELFREAVFGKEELLDKEILGISKLVGVPTWILKADDLVLMNNKKYQHREKIRDIKECVEIIEREAEKGKKYPILFVQGIGKALYEDYIKSFEAGKGSYCGFVGIKERIKDVFFFQKMEENRNNKRGV